MRTVAIVLLLMIPACASDVYIAQASAGANDGTSCANAKAVSYFNSAGNWSATPTGIQIGPDTTVHLCGTFTGTAGQTMLTFQGSGSSGHPIILLFESGANFTAPYWGSGSTGAIYANAKSFITIDGGRVGSCSINPNDPASIATDGCTFNGTISNTADGTALANQQDTTGIYFDNASHDTEVKNLNFTNLYQRTEDTNDATSAIAINCAGGSNHHWHHLKIDHTARGLGYGFNGGESSIEMDHLAITASDHGLIIGNALQTGNLNTVKLHDIDFADSFIWDSPANIWHHDGTHVFANCSGGCTITNLQEWNNNCHGIFSKNTNNTTACIFVEGSITSPVIFNNTGSYGAGTTILGIWNNGFIQIKQATGATVYNNTLVGVNNGSSWGNAGGVGAGGSATWKNNVVEYTDGPYTDASSTITLDYNTWWSPSMWWTSGAVHYSTFAAYQAGGQGAHDQNGNNPTLDANFLPLLGSSAVGAATNLTSLGITALDSDKGAVLRPSSAAWDAGAYQSQALPVGPAPALGIFAMTWNH